MGFSWFCKKGFQFINTAVQYGLSLFTCSLIKLREKKKKYLISFLVTSLHYEKTKQNKAKTKTTKVNKNIKPLETRN